MQTRTSRPTSPLALLIVTLLAATPARAQPPTPAATGPGAAAPSEAAKAMVGAPWEFSNADRDRRCTVSFRIDGGPHGMKLDLDKACGGVFPFLKEVTGWTLAANDFLRFVDAKGKALLEFSEVEQGIFEAPKPGEGILFLQPVASLQKPPPSPDEMAGAWEIQRGGKALCSLTLATTPVPEGLAITLAPGCDSLVARFAPTAWQMDRGELVLTGAQSRTWRFEESEPKSWQRVPETRDPLQLVKK
jgi:hypothetical protein